MKHTIVLTMILAAAVASSGCATKKFVRETTGPIQAKVDQVGEQSTKNSSDIATTQKEVKDLDEKTEAGISAARERAMTAESRANQAMTKAEEAGAAASEAKTSADANRRQLDALRGVVANIDDYRISREATVQFGFGKDALDDDSKKALDELASGTSNLKRYVISVEGFTDATGPAKYNEALSQRRADNVVKYLVAEHNVPVYRIHKIGLGEDKLLDEGKTREARAKNRRVEVKVLSAEVGSETATAAVR